MREQDLELATLGGGCFWCSEAIFKRLRGVEEVFSGYSGGKLDEPSYEEVLSGETGHVEAIQIKFDPKVISYEKLLEIFFKLHDPTTINQQGADIGEQYRSVIFYHNEKQKEVAERVREGIERSGYYDKKIVTEIAPYSVFYKAEEYHQNFYEANKDYPYCKIVIDPKIQKLYKDFKGEIRE